MSKRKYRQGRALGPVEACMHIAYGRPVYYRHKVYTYGWSQNWNIHSITVWARGGHIKRAIKMEEK